MAPQNYCDLGRAIDETVVCILAGGKGERLMPLTGDRAKPAVPFGGKYRVIDFVMSNCVNSDFNQIYVFPQHLNQSLNQHLLNGWNIFLPERNQFMQIVSPQGRVRKDWYSGTAASVHDNLFSIGQTDPKYVIILSSDQVYKMDYRLMLQAHIESGAELTIASLAVSKHDAHEFGVLEINDDQRIVDFCEKPICPKTIPGRPEEALISMGIYIFNSSALVDILERDALDRHSKHDFGKNIVPKMLKQGNRLFAYLFDDHWVDIGSPLAYYNANMDLISVKPKFNLYDPNWLWRTFERPAPPLKVVFRSQIRSSIVCDGCVLDECNVSNSVISPNVRIGRNTSIANSVIMNGVVIGDNVTIRNATIDKDNIIPDGTIITPSYMKFDGIYTITETDPEIVIIPRYCNFWKGR